MLEYSFLYAGGRWNIVDVMGGTKTSPRFLETAKTIYPVHSLYSPNGEKRDPGFLLNSVWRAIKKQTLYLWGEGSSIIEISTGLDGMFTPSHGPFFLMDLVGSGPLVYDIEMSYYNESKDPRLSTPALEGQNRS